MNNEIDKKELKSLYEETINRYIDKYSLSYFSKVDYENITAKYENGHPTFDIPFIEIGDLQVIRLKFVIIDDNKLELVLGKGNMLRTKINYEPGEYKINLKQLAENIYANIEPKTNLLTPINEVIPKRDEYYSSINDGYHKHDDDFENIVYKRAGSRTRSE